MKTGTLAMIAGAAVAGTLAFPALADTWTGVYGNTIDATYADGRTAKVFVEPDHSYSIKLPDGTILKGAWADGNGQSCFTLTDPPGAPVCFPLKDYHVGDTFSGTDSTGAFTSVIHAGR